MHRDLPTRRSSRRAGALLGPAIVGGAALGLTAAVLNARRARDAEREHPPTGEFLEIEGVRLHYLDRGSGPTVLLLHGNGAMAEDFVVSGLFDLLAERHRVIAVDRPGFGYSERPRNRLWTPSAQARLLAGALDVLDAGRTIVVGHSWGTMTALALGLDYRFSTGGLVLVSGYYFPTPRLDAALLSGPAVPVLGDVARYTVAPPLARAIAPQLVRRVFAPQKVPRRFRGQFPLELALRPSQLRASAAESALMIPSAASLRPRYGTLRVPAVLLAGTADRIVSFDRQTLRLHRELPNSTLVPLPGISHMAHYSAPGEIARAVDELAARETPLRSEPQFALSAA